MSASNGIRNRSYEHSLVLLAPAERVFDLLTTPAGLCSWWVDDAAVSGNPPSRMRLVWGTGAQAMVGELSLQDDDKPRCFQTTWMRGGDKDILSDGSNHRGFRVSICQRYTLSGFGAELAYDVIYRATIDGWDRSMALLAKACERSSAGTSGG
jgi:hypothetical protein